MSIRGMVNTVLLMVLLILISPFTVSIHGGQGEEGPGTRAGDYVNFDAFGLGNHNIGNTVDFRVVVSNVYQGQHWEGDPYNYNHRTLYEVTLQMYPNDVRMEDGTPAPGIIKSTSPTSLAPYNGELSEGFTISYQRNYYSSADNDNFEFKISTMNVKQGYYELPLKITSRVHVDFSTMDPSGYSWQTVMEFGYVSFHVNSNIQGLNMENQLQPYESGSVPLYSGTTYMTLRGPSITPRSSGIEDLDIELTMPEDYFIVQVPVFRLETFIGYNYPAWKIQVYSSTPPGDYTGKLVCTYSREGEEYVEGPYNATVTVENTPLLIPPDTADMTEPTLVTRQKTNSLAFEFQMINGGNVDLESVTVRLDLDSAMFLSQMEYYYDEDDHSNKVYAPLEYKTDNVKVGQVIDVFFPAVSVYGMLPPGDYLIPMDYKVTFIDPSMDELTGTRLSSYQWDEMYMNDYLDTMYFREDPRPTDLKKPHLMMRVLDDMDGADISMECDQILQSGSRSIPVQFSLLNREFYSVRDANVEIRSSNPSLVWSSVTPGDVGLLASKEDFFIPSSSFGNPGMTSISGMIDIAGDCPTGDFEVQMVISGLDDVSAPIQITHNETIKIKAEPGRLTIASISTGSVEPGKGFTMRVNLMNTGDVTINEFETMLQCSDNMISIETPVATGSGVSPGELVQVDFECKAAKCMDYEKSSQLMLLTRSSDEEGNMKDFTDDVGLPLNIVAAREPDELGTESAIKSVGLYFFLAVVFGTLLFSIALVLSVSLVLFREKIVSSIGKNDKKEKTDKEEESQKKAEPLGEPAPMKPSIDPMESRQQMHDTPSPPKTQQPALAPGQEPASQQSMPQQVAPAQSQGPASQQSMPQQVAPAQSQGPASQQGMPQQVAPAQSQGPASQQGMPQQQPTAWHQDQSGKPSVPGSSKIDDIFD